MNWLENKKVKFAFLTGLTVALYAMITLIIAGFDGGSNFWISFVFAIISFPLAFFITYLSARSTKRLSDWLFSLPIIRWCVIYVVAELVLSTAFMLIPDLSWKIAFLPQFLLPILFLVIVVPCFAQRKHVASVQQETVRKVSYMRQMHAKLTALLPRTEDAAVKKELEKAIDLVRHSDPMSADSLAEIEEKMASMVEQLDSLIRNGHYDVAAPVAKELSLLVVERSQLALAAKQIQY